MIAPHDASEIHMSGTRPDQASPPPTADAHLSRDFVTVQGRFGPRQVHYRRGGRGPVVLLLHQSPQSSRDMEPLIEAWGASWTLIAPDSPGYGWSEPLRKNRQPVSSASIDDFALATLEFADALGLGRFGIYGFHTGASIGMALAQLFPDRVAAVAGNGLVVLTDDERAAILRDYLPPLVPRWDGGHLAWLWGRLREQVIFFPWHDRRAATRMRFPVPPADRLQAGLLEFLAAGDHYPVAYAAAFLDRAERRLPALTVPALITAAARDPLANHLARIGARSSSVQIVAAPDPAAALEHARAHLCAHPGELPRARAPANQAAGPVAGQVAGEAAITSEYLGLPGGQIRALRVAARSGPGGQLLVLLHPVAGSATVMLDLATTLAGWTHVLAVDLPGHGASDPPPPGLGALAGTVARLRAALAPLAAGSTITVLGVGSSAPVALELARELPETRGVILLGPPDWSASDISDWREQGLPPLQPVWSGGHLLEAWHLVRDGRLFSPWFRREPAGIRPGEPELDDVGIHREVSDLLRANGSWQALLRDTLGYRPGAANGGEPPVTRLAEPPGNWAPVFARVPGRSRLSAS
ncbi:MAG: alpha/beta hydrolase [Gammaproteobacteria bacterium]